MKHMLKSVSAVFLCILIVLASLSAVFSYFVRSTILSEDFYLGVVATPTYISMVKDAINADFKAQSSYVGIPEEVFASTLDDAELHLMLRKHIASVTAYLNGLSDYSEPEYPMDLLTGPLYAYLEQQSAATGTAPTQDQYDQLASVAKDSAVIIQNQVCLIDLNLVKDRGIFQTAHAQLLHLKNLFVPSLLAMAACSALLVLLYLREWRKWLNGILVSLWVTGTMLMVPTLVLQITGLTRRLAIKTAYLKYFVDSVLSDMNLYFLVLGILIFGITSVSLIALKWTHHHTESRRRSVLAVENP